jgi:hypothetical protein
MTMIHLRPCLVLVALVTALLFAHVAGAEAVLTLVSGNVEIGQGEPAEWSAATTGAVVSETDRVRTGADGRAEITMDAGVLRVHENSMLRLPPAVADAVQVELHRGRSLFDVLRREGRRFEVQTPTVVVSVKGTRFGVDAGSDIGEVTVYRGTVGVREAGAADAVETLVREGFLATGGIGIPVELDVSSATDPWQSWQQFDRARDRERPARMSELDRARDTLHRQTAADVIVQAAERRPEIAKRLAKMQKERRDRDRRGRRDANQPSEAMAPAAPDPSAVDSKTNMLDGQVIDPQRMQNIDEMRELALESQKVVDGDRADDELQLEATTTIGDLGGSKFSSDGFELDFAAVYEMSPKALLLVRESLDHMRTEYDSGSFNPETPTDLLSELKYELVDRGMTGTEALLTIQTLTGDGLTR